MGFSEAIETINEIIHKALEKFFAGSIEKTTEPHTSSFSENVAVEIVATLIVAFLGILVSRRLWKFIHRRWRAATIRKAAGTAFVIVRCPIHNDTGEAIGNEIAARLETAFRAFAGWPDAGIAPLNVEIGEAALLALSP
jgi:hypothetical protein